MGFSTGKGVSGGNLREERKAFSGFAALSPAWLALNWLPSFAALLRAWLCRGWAFAFAALAFVARIACPARKFRWLFTFAALAWLAIPAHALTIANASGGYNVTAGAYSAFLTENGSITELRANGSAWNLLENGGVELEGITILDVDLARFPVGAIENTSINVTFTVTNGGIWTYAFGENGFNLTVDLANESQLIVAPNIDLMDAISKTGTSESEDLSDGVGITNDTWKNVTYTTMEGARLSMRLDGDPIGTTTAKTDYYNSQQVWGLNTLTGAGGGMTGGIPFLIIFSVNASALSPANITIEAGAWGVNATAETYRTFTSGTGAMKSLRANGSIWDVLGDELEDSFPGIHLTDPLTFPQPITAQNYAIKSNSVRFNSTYGTWDYVFRKNGFNVRITPTGELWLIVTPNMDVTASVGMTGTNFSINLSDGVGISNETWKNVTYATLEGVRFGMRLVGDPVGGTTGSTDYYNNQQIWGLYSKFLPEGAMAAGTTYLLNFRLNASNFTAAEEPVNIIKTPSGYNVTTPGYRAFVNDTGVFENLIPSGSALDLLGTDFQPEFQGIYLTNASTPTAAMNATGSILAGNRIRFLTPAGNVTYKFNRLNHENVDVFIKTGSAPDGVNFFISPDISYMKGAHKKGAPSTYIDLTDEVGGDNDSWSGVTFTSIEDITLTAYVRPGYTGSGIAQTGYHNYAQHWGIEGWTSPGSIGSDEEYGVAIYLNRSQMRPRQYAENITYTPGVGYNITQSTNDYAMEIDEKGVMRRLLIDTDTQNSLWNENGTGGIYLVKAPPYDEIVNATSSYVSGDRIVFRSPSGTWRYQFNERDFSVTVRTTNESGETELYFSPNPQNMIAIYNRTNYLQKIGISGGCTNNESYNKPWPEVTYHTRANDLLSVHLQNHPVKYGEKKTEGQLNCRNNVTPQWGLELRTSAAGGPMLQSEAANPGVYKISFELDPRKRYVETFTYTRTWDGTEGTGEIQFPGNYSIYSNEYLPLLVCAHGFLKNSSACFEGELDEAADGKNWLMLSPQGYGRTESPSSHGGKDLGWAGAQQDIIDAINYVRNASKVNESRIYYVGIGGAELTAVATHPDIFAAAASWFGVSNVSSWLVEIRNGLIGNSSWAGIIESEIGGNETAYPFEYHRRSAIYYAKNFEHLPLKLFHGENDTEVNYTQSRDMYNASTGNKQFNSSNTGHCPACINANATIEWLENFTLERPENVTTIHFTSDAPGKIYWANISLLSVNTPGPDSNDTIDRWGILNASINASSNYLRIISVNIGNITIKGDVSPLNLSAILAINISGEEANRTFNLKSQSKTFLISANGTYLNMVLENQTFLPLEVRSASPWETGHSGITVYRPYIKKSAYSLLGTEWSGTTLNSTLNVTASGQNVTYYIPAGVYPPGGWDVRNGSGSLLANGTGTGEITLNMTSSGVQQLLLETETLPPNVTFAPPTPANGQLINTTYVFINASILDISGIGTCLLEWNYTANLSMTKTANSCYRNVTSLADNANYTYRIIANDTLGNMGYSGYRNLSVNYNNAPRITPPIPNQTKPEDYGKWSLNLTPYGNDSDGDRLYWSTSSTNANVTNQTNVTFSYPPNWYGVEYIQITVNDSQLSAFQIIMVNVTPVNDPPTVSGMPNVTINEDEYNDTLYLDNYLTDVDTPKANIVWTTTGNNSIIIDINLTTRRLNVTTKPNWYGSERVTFIANDGEYASNQTINITALPMNEPPEITPPIPNQTMPEDSPPWKINLSNYGYDVENDTLYWSTNSTNANITNQTNVTFSYPPNWNGIELIRITVNDSQLSASQIIKVTITPVNDPPILAGMPNVTINEDEYNDTLYLDNYLTDVDTPKANIVWTTTGNNSILININPATRQLNVTTKPNWHGSELVTFTANDGEYASNQTINITALPVNDPPQITPPIPNQTKPEDYGPWIINLTGYDPDGDTLYWSTSSTNANITNQTNVTFSYPPNWNGIEYIQITVNDSQLSTFQIIMVNVTPVNDPPTVSGMPNITINEDEYNDTLYLDNYLTDVDTPKANIVWTTTGNNSIIIDINLTTRRLNVTTKANWFGSERVTFIANDGEYASNQTINITALSVNDPPVLDFIGDQMAWVGVPYAYTVNATDAEGDALCYADNATFFNVSCVSGLINFTAAASEIGEYSVNVSVNDTFGLSDWQAVNFTVYPKNTPPNITAYSPADNPEIAEGASQRFNISAYDEEGDNLTITWWVNGQNISGAYGQLDYTFAANYSSSEGSPYLVAVTVRDRWLSANHSWLLNVTDVNRPPLEVGLLLPKNGTAVPNSAPFFSWNNTPDPDGDPLNYTLMAWNASSIVVNVTIQASNYTPTPQVDGTYTWLVRASDNRGGSNNSATWQFSVDTIPPQIAILDPAEGRAYPRLNLTLNYSLGEQPSECWYSLNGGPNVSISGCANTTFNAPEGQYSLAAYANDSAGNVNSSIVRFQTDITPPSIELLSPLNNTQIQIGAPIYFRVNDTNLNYSAYRLNGEAGTLENLTWDGHSIMGEIGTAGWPAIARQNVTIYAVDNATNSAESGFVFFTVNVSLAINKFEANATYAYVNETMLFAVNYSSPWDLTASNITIRLNGSAVAALNLTSSTPLLEPIIGGILQANYSPTWQGDYSAQATIKTGAQTASKTLNFTAYSNRTNQTIYLADKSNAVVLSYHRPQDGMLLTGLNGSIAKNKSFTVPAGVLNVRVGAEDGAFSATLIGVNTSAAPNVTLYLLKVSVGSISDEAMDIGAEKRYRPKAAYAFDVANGSNMPSHYRITFNYSVFGISDTQAILAFKGGYNLESGNIGYSAGAFYAGSNFSKNTSEKTISINLSSLSVFMLVEDAGAAPSQQQYYGGGGYGGAVAIVAAVPNVLYLYPELRAEQEASVMENYSLKFTFKGANYTIAIIRIETRGVELSINKGSNAFVSAPVEMDLDGDGKNDLRVSIKEIREPAAVLGFTFLAYPAENVPRGENGTRNATNDIPIPEGTLNVPQEQPWENATILISRITTLEQRLSYLISQIEVDKRTYAATLLLVFVSTIASLSYTVYKRRLRWRGAFRHPAVWHGDFAELGKQVGRIDGFLGKKNRRVIVLNTSKLDEQVRRIDSLLSKKSREGAKKRYIKEE